MTGNCSSCPKVELNAFLKKYHDTDNASSNDNNGDPY